MYFLLVCMRCLLVPHLTLCVDPGLLPVPEVSEIASDCLTTSFTLFLLSHTKLYRILMVLIINKSSSC